jgi:hypothetical protein
LPPAYQPPPNPPENARKQIRRLVTFKDTNDENTETETTTKKVRFQDIESEKRTKPKKVRRVHTHVPPNPTDNVLIIDSAADQSCVGQGFRILYYTGATIHLDGGALDTMGGGNYPLVSAAAVVTDPTTTREIIVIINQAAYNPSLAQHESLLLL